MGAEVRRCRGSGSGLCPLLCRGGAELDGCREMLDHLAERSARDAKKSDEARALHSAETSAGRWTLCNLSTAGSQILRPGPEHLRTRNPNLGTPNLRTLEPAMS